MPSKRSRKGQNGGAAPRQNPYPKVKRNKYDPVKSTRGRAGSFAPGPTQLGGPHPIRSLGG